MARRRRKVEAWGKVEVRRLKVTSPCYICYRLGKVSPPPDHGVGAFLVD